MTTKPAKFPQANSSFPSSLPEPPLLPIIGLDLEPMIGLDPEPIIPEPWTDKAYNSLPSVTLDPKPSTCSITSESPPRGSYDWSATTDVAVHLAVNEYRVRSQVRLPCGTT
nr:hypothetical protein [Tanacetum cinerariifolium]